MKLETLLMATLLIFCGYFIWQPKPAFAQSFKEETPELIEEEIASELQSLLDETLAEQEIPGAILYVDTPEGNWMGASGVANLKTKQPMKPSDRCRIGSITKTFVAVVVLQLYEEEELNLDDAIADWLPEDISDRLPQSKEITIYQLLNHTSSLPDYTENDDFNQAIIDYPSYQWTPQEVLEYVYDLEPQAAPGEEYSYSNTNYIVLELIVEAATGNTLAKELRDRIYTPLGLKNTFMEQKEAIPGGFVSGYSDWDGDKKIDDMTQLEPWGLGDGGIISNGADLARFARGLFADEELLEPETLEEMLDSVDDGEGAEYGLGVSVWETEWGEAWGHQGRTGGFLSTMMYLPNRDITVVAIANDADNADPDAIAEKALAVVLGEAE